MVNLWSVTAAGEEEKKQRQRDLDGSKEKMATGLRGDSLVLQGEYSA